MAKLNKKDLKKVKTITVYKATCPECGDEIEITSEILDDNYSNGAGCPECYEFIEFEG